MEKEIAGFRKNATEEVIVKITEYKGQNYIDIRAYVRPVIPSDNLKATRKGLCIKPELLTDLQNALKKVEKDLSRGKGNQN